MDSLFIEQHILLSWQRCIAADKTAVLEEEKIKECSIIQGPELFQPVSMFIQDFLTETKHDFVCFLFLLRV